jgi:triacylglycerol lipase
MSVLTKLSANFYDRAAFAGFQAQGGFSLANAKALMWLSQLSYETDEPDKVKTLLAPWNLALVPGGVVSSPATSSLPMPRTEAIVAQGNGAAFVAFAGTDPLVIADWVADFNVRPHMGTTEGFALALAAAMPAIRALIAPLVGVPVFVTGHSLGGALTVLAALELAKAGVSVEAVYTFGMPRPGNAHFKSDYDAPLGAATYRLVNGDDIVPTVGPSFLGFRHVGRLLRCAPGAHFNAGALAADTSSDDPPFAGGARHGLFDQLLAPLGGGVAGLLHNPGPHLAGRPDFVKVLIQLLPDSIKAHVPENYIAALT